MHSETTTKSRSRPIKVGDRVEVLFGVRRVPAVVIEDRGDIGVGGRRLLRVRVEIDDLGNVREFDYPADELTSSSTSRAGVKDPIVRRALSQDRVALEWARDALRDGHAPGYGFEVSAVQALDAVRAASGGSVDLAALADRLRVLPARKWTVTDVEAALVHVIAALA